MRFCSNKKSQHSLRSLRVCSRQVKSFDNGASTNGEAHSPRAFAPCFSVSPIENFSPRANKTASYAPVVNSR